jgi:hypothetical protein
MVAIPVIIALLGLTSAVMGAYMSGKRHPVWFAAFIAIGLVGAVLAGLQSWQSKVAQDGLKASIEKIPKSIRDEFLKSGGNVTVAAQPKPWWLTPEQISVLAKRMEPFAKLAHRTDEDDGMINVAYFDSESERFAADFVSAFRTAGWNLPPGKGIRGRTEYEYPRSGIILMVHSQYHIPMGVPELEKTLREFGLDPTLSTDETIGEDRFRIVIGVRPKD